MRNFILLGMAVIALVFSANTTLAADAARVEKIGVVDVQALIATSKAGKNIQEQLDKHRDSFKAEFAKLEKDLDATRKKLEDDKANQNTPEFAAKRKDFETRMMNAQKLVQQKRMTLDKGAGDAILQLRKAIVKAAADVADKNKYTLVVTRDNVVLAEKEMDITDKVMEQLNKDLPSVKVKLDPVKE